MKPPEDLTVGVSCIAEEFRRSVPRFDPLAYAYGFQRRRDKHVLIEIKQ